MDIRLYDFEQQLLKGIKIFLKKMTKSYSGTFDVIMGFFEWHGISPFRKTDK